MTVLCCLGWHRVVSDYLGQHFCLRCLRGQPPCTRQRPCPTHRRQAVA